MTEPLWRPDPERAAATAMARFAVSAGHDRFEDLYRWSIADPDAFWSQLWSWCGLPGDPGPVIDRGEWFGAARFFPEATLNVAEQILWGRGAPGEAELWVQRDEAGNEAGNETGGRRVMTRAEGVALVAQVAAALRADGVVAGDRVVVWLPNIIEAQVVMLAAASIGAVFSSTSPDFGVDGVLDRFSQIEPVVLVAADGYRYGGKVIDCLDRIDDIVAGLASLRRVVLVSFVGDAPFVGDASARTGATSWADWVAPHLGSAPAYAQLPFDHPWYVLFSSGTTGVPKCIVHRAGGVLLQHLKEQQLHCDIVPSDRVMYFTTCGWMMWNWMASVPASGATTILYDGSPFHPSPSALFDLVEQERLTFLGVGAKFIDSVRKEALSPRTTHDVSSLRALASTGSPLSIEGFEWVYAELSADLHLASISGGTDLCACFVAGDPTSPVYAGEIQRPGLGMAVDVWTPEGIPAVVDERGELVCTEPFPSMPLGFWADDDGSRYRAAYYQRFENIDRAEGDGQAGPVWAHGDFASWTEHGGMVIHGRSDTTLNPGGVRIGTAEIYRQVEQLPDVLESLVFGQEWDGDTRIVLLVRLAPGIELTDELIAAIKARIRTGSTPRHVPAVVAVVADLPRTRSGKLAELAVTDAVNGREVRNTTALANPETLALIIDAVDRASSARQE